MENKNKATLINMFAAVITVIIQMIISFWLSPFVVRKLGEEAYGFINLANNFVSYASLVSVAVNSMASRFISVEYNSKKFEEAKSYFSTIFWANCVLYSIILFCSFVLIYHIESIVNISTSLIWQVKITFLLSFINMGTSLIGTVYTAAAFTTEKMHLNSVVQILSNITKGVLIFVLFSIFPAKIYLLSVATLVSGGVMLVGNYILTKKLFPGFDTSIHRFKFVKLLNLVKSGYWILISNISNLLLNGLDLLFSNLFISSVIMGRLSLSKQIPLALSNALGVFSSIFSSSMTKKFTLYGNESLIEETKSQQKVLTIFFTIPFAGVIVYGFDFLHLWLSDTHFSFLQYLEIYILMIILLIDVVISTYMYSIHSIFIALDKVKVYSVVLLISSVISILLTFIFLKTTRLGVYAIAGTSTMVLGITHGIVIPARAAKLLKVSAWTFWKMEIKSWCTLFIACLIFIFMRNISYISNWGTFVTNVVISSLIGYISVFYITFSREERKMLYKLMKNR